MADWKENKVVGIVAGVVVLITVVFIVLYSKNRFAGEKARSDYPPKEGVPAVEMQR